MIDSVTARNGLERRQGEPNIEPGRPPSLRGENMRIAKIEDLHCDAAGAIFLF
jgi:hypothetical protein